MPFPMPTAEELTRQQEGFLESAIRRARPEVDPAAIARAVRSEKGMLAQVARNQALVLYSNHLHLRWWGDQYLPDTSDAEFLIRHGDIWGIYKRAAVQAVGYATLAGAPGLPIPVGLQAVNANGAVVETVAAGVVSGVGTLTVSLRAVTGGVAGNAAGLAVLPLVTPMAGLDPQSLTLDAQGLAGGAEIEKDPSLLARILTRIQQPPMGGAAFDYDTWVRNAFAVAKVRVIPNWTGYGSVGVVVAMGTAAAPVVATAGELAAILAYLGDINSVTGLRPVTAEVIPIAHVPIVVPMTIALKPDTAGTRAAVTSAVMAFFAAEAQIGQAIPRSRLSEAISAATGEYAHIITLPAGDIACAARELAVPGVITWAAYP